VVVGRERGRLDNEHILAADVLLNLDEDLHVGEAPDLSPGERDIEMIADGFGERAIGIAGDDFEGGGHAGCTRNADKGEPSERGRLSFEGLITA
jgi:hypothetical protein